MTARVHRAADLNAAAEHGAAPSRWPVPAWWDALARSSAAATVALSSARVSVLSNNPRVIEELVGYLGGKAVAARSASGPDPDWTVGIVDTPEPVSDGIGGEPVVLHDFGPDTVAGTRSEQHPGVFVDADGQLVIVDAATRRIIIAGRYRAGSLYPHREAALTGIAHEIVRHLLRLRLEYQGGLVVHASAVSLQEEAVLIVGDKRAGKSTLSTALLLHGDADYLAGDRVFVWPLADRSGWLAAGWPTALRLNPGTVSIFAGLRAVADAARHAPAAPAGRKLHIWPADIPGVLARPVRRSAVVTTVLFLGTETGQPSTEVREISRERALPLLASNLLTPHDPHHPNWLDLPRPSDGELSTARAAFLDQLGGPLRLLELPVCGWTEPALRTQVAAVLGKLRRTDQPPRHAAQSPAGSPAEAGTLGTVSVVGSARGPLVLPGAPSAAVPPPGHDGGEPRQAPRRAAPTEEPTEGGPSDRHPTTGQEVH